MSSQHSTERLIDLLYGELTPEEEAEVREELGESATMRAELDGLDKLLGDVRSAMPEEQVSASVHGSILEAARAAARQSPEATPRRRSEGSESMGLWGRIFQGQGSQFALVAAVLVAGVFVAKFAGDSENPTMAPAADISAVEEPAPPPVPVATPMEAVELQDESEAAAELPSAAPEEKSVAAQLVEPRAPSEPEPTARDRGESDRRQRTKGPAAKKDSRPARRRMTKGTAAPSTLELDTPDDRAASRTRQGRALDRPLAEAQREPDRAVDVVERESAPAPMAAKAEAKPTSEGAPAYRPQAGTIAAVEQRARANDYNGTIAASDAFLAADTGSATERARALQLKADALLRLGRYAEADRVYASIQQDYPTYQTTAVNSARARIQERQSRQPARRNSVAPASSDPE